MVHKQTATTKINTALDQVIADAVAAGDSIQRRKIIAKGRNLVKPTSPYAHRKIGRPSRYTEAIAETIIDGVSSGKTLTGMCRELDLSPHAVYGWIEKYPEFSKQYERAKFNLAQQLVDEMIDNARTLTPDMAITEKVRSQIYQWASARFAPAQFSDTRRLELSGQINHTHTHQLTEDQKRRIAESWLMSRQEAPAIEAETTGPDLPSLENEGVSTVADADVREIPPRQQKEVSKRKPRNPPGATTRGRGRSSKPKLDESSDSP